MNFPPTDLSEDIFVEEIDDLFGVMKWDEDLEEYQSVWLTREELESLVKFVLGEKDGKNS
jgi:hypothetical protein